MPGVLLLAAAVAVNYRRHRAGRSTICATARRALPRPVSAAALAGGWLYLTVHIWRGYPPTAPATTVLEET